jgi:hypothetical protein
VKRLALAALFASCAAPSAAHVSAPSHRPMGAEWRDFPTVPRTTTTARASRSAGVARREAVIHTPPQGRRGSSAPTSSSSTSAPPARTDGGEPATPPRVAPPVSPNWAALRNCESGGDYANKRSATFRGAYQFSRTAWVSVGGSGDPADASPAEQDMRAQRLYERRGRTPWPYCGRLL